MSTFRILVFRDVALVGRFEKSSNRRNDGVVITSNFKFLTINPTRCTNFSNFFLEWKLHVLRTVPLSIIRSFSLYTAMVVYVIWVCWQLGSSKLSPNPYDIYHCCVQWKTPDNGQRNRPKHVKFHSKKKFEKLVQLVGFTIRNEIVSWHKLYTFEYIQNHFNGAINVSIVNLFLKNPELLPYHQVTALVPPFENHSPVTHYSPWP